MCRLGLKHGELLLFIGHARDLVAYKWNDDDQLYRSLKPVIEQDVH